MTEYTVSKGQQYDRNGATVTWSEYGAECDAKFDAAAQFQAGDFPSVDDLPTLSAVVARVISSGVSEAASVGEPQVAATIAVRHFAACPHYTPDQGCPLHGEYCAA